MPNEGEGNDPGQRDQATKGWHNQGCQGRNQRRQGNHAADQQCGRQARSRGVSPGSKATSMIGRGSRRPSDTSEQLERSAPTSELYTPSTWQTSQQPWIPWTYLTPLSHRPPIQVTKWRSNDGSMCTRSISTRCKSTQTSIRASITL